MQSLTFDVRLVVRGLFRRPGFFMLAAGTLALSIGATATLYRVTGEVVLRPRALLQADELYVLWETNDLRDGLMAEISYPDFLDWRNGASLFEDMAAMGSSNWSHGWSEGDGRVREIPYRAVSWSFFDVLGIEAAMGRTFVAEDDARDAARVVVVSHDFWQTRLGGALDVVGRTIRLGPDGDEPYTVVGVMRPEFGFPRDAQLWTPLGRDLAGFGAYEAQVGVLFAVGRLQRGASPERAEAEVSAVVRRLSREVHTRNRRHPDAWRAFLTPVQSFELGSTPLGLFVLGAAAASLLLISGLSVGGLVLARSFARRHELAVHTALGAGRVELARRTLLESTVLVVAGIVGAVAVCRAATPLLLTRLPVPSRLMDGLSWQRSDTLFFVGACALTTVLVALPTLISIRPSQILRDIASAMATKGGLQSWHRPLIVSATALAMVLTVTAALLGRSYAELERADLGFRPEGVLSFQVAPPDGSSRESENRFFREILARTESVEGVVRAAVVRNRPMAIGAIGDDWPFIYEGQSVAELDANPTVNSTVISPGYFQVMGTPIVAGRDFDERDRSSAPRVVVVGASLARYAWPHETAVGKRVSFGNRDDDGELIWHRVVGVVADARYRGLTTSRLDLYHTFEQAEFSPFGIVALTRSDPYALVPAIQQRVRAFDDTINLERVTSMEDVVAAAMSPWRFNMLVASAFAAFALALSGLGLFGVVAYAASQRTREMGIRSAIGATPAHIRTLLTRDGLAMVLVGVATGAFASLTGAKLLSSLLYGITDRDPGAFVAAAAVLSTVGFLACYVPARRAARVSPLVALRHE